ncbi:hypothetical protein SLS60_001106 [Paraconiothyrium brasiliense]|uniref:Uncharacterized protein n=1 Tax=Paraconiothyrium brasiliense TaxID=300254 RepID=A0ABR3S841_9PLEO
MRVVISILLLSSIAYASVLPPHKNYNRDLPDTINARAPTEDAAITHNVDDVAIVANAKKDGKNFFKELGQALSDFDPVDFFRAILAGLLGLKDDGTAATNGTSPSPTTTVSIATTPIEATLATVKTISTKTVTTTQLQKSSVRVPLPISADDAELAFSILPAFPTEEPLELTGLAPTQVFTPHHIIFTPAPDNATTVPNATAPGITVTYEPEETLSILPFVPPGEDLADNVTFIGPFNTSTAPTTATEEVVEPVVSILPLFESGKGFSDIFILPPTAAEIPPLETFSVVTAPVTDVPGATLLPVATIETMSILPFFGPGEHLSDNVSVPTPTEQVPVLPIPVFTGSEESLDAFAGEDVAITTPAEVEANTALETEIPDANNHVLVPLLELVNGTYVLPTTKTPDFVTPVLSWPPPGFNITAKPAISTRRGPPRKTSSRRSTRPTKPIVLPPPLIRPTNFPLNQTFFANQTEGVASPVAKSNRPLILTNPLRPTLEALALPIPFPLPRPIPPFPIGGPFFNNTRGLRPIGRPTRPLILTDPLRTMLESFPTLKPILNGTTFVRPTRPLILTNPLRPPIETFEPLDARRTTTRTFKSRSTTVKTVIVIPTPVTDVPDVSVLGVDVPADEPLPSDAGLVGPGFPFDEGEDVPADEPLPTDSGFISPDFPFDEGDDDFISENPRPTFPIIDFDDPDVPTPTLIIDDFDSLDVSNDTVGPTIAPIAGDIGDMGVPSDLVEPTATPVIDDFGELNVSVALPVPTPLETDVSLSDLSPSFVDIFEAPTTLATVILHPALGVKATLSAELDVALLGDSPSPSDLVVSNLPLLTPTPTPRPFPNIISRRPHLVLPSGFPLPKPVIDVTSVLFPPGGSVKRLAEICGDEEVTTVTLPILQNWYGPNAYPALKKYPGCAPANPRQAIQAPGLLNCTALGREVQTCQKAGKRVLLGVRADAPSAVNGNLKWGSADPGILGLKLPLPLPPGPFLGRPGHAIFPQAGNLTTVKVDGKVVPAPNLFDALHTPTGLAATLFSLFGEGHAERADLRPLGPDTPSNFSSDSIMWVAKPLGEEVVLDGFDVRTPGQWKGTPQAALVEKFVGSLRETVEKAWKEGGSKKGGLNDLGVKGPGEVVSGYI